MRTEITGLVDKIQNYCIHDGDGIRMTVFMKGCDMRCPWCSNPESLTATIQLARNPAKCTNCGYCVKLCPNGAIEESTKDADSKKCSLCGKCVEACAKGAWNLYGRQMSIGEVVAEVAKDRAYYKKSGGGVTFSGGECTTQPEFLKSVLEACKNASINTAVESNGNAPGSVYEELAPYVDTFLIDIKHMDSQKHKEATGVGNERILDNIRKIVFDLDKRLMLRVPLIPGYNDSDDNMEKTAAFAAELNKSGNLAMVNVLPYHSLGAGKYGVMKMDYKMENTRPPSQEKIDKVLQIFKRAGVPAQQGG